MIGRGAAALAALVLALVGCTGGQHRPIAGRRCSAAAHSTYPRRPRARPPCRWSSGPRRADERVAFSVSLHLPGSAQMDAYLAGLTQPGSASYHRYLTRERVRRDASDCPTRGQPRGRVAQRRGTARRRPRRSGPRSQSRARPGRSTAARHHARDRLDAELACAITCRSGSRRFPQDIRSCRRTVVGLDTEPVQHPALGTHLHVRRARPRDHAASSWRAAYEITPLHDAGFVGDGMNIAIVSFDTFTAGRHSGLRPADGHHRRARRERR